MAKDYVSIHRVRRANWIDFAFTPLAALPLAIALLDIRHVESETRK